MVQGRNKTLTKEESLEKAMTYCGRAEHCLSEVRAKLYQWGAQEEDIETVLEILVDQRFVDEVRFAEMYVRDKITYTGWGRMKVAQSLRIKRIPDAIYKPILEAFDESAYEEVVDKALAAKWRQVKGKDFYDKKAKLFRFAMGRGFESYVVQAWLEKNKD